LCLPGLIDIRHRQACGNQQGIVDEERLLDTEPELQSLAIDRTDEPAPHIRKHIAIDDAKPVKSVRAIRCHGAGVRPGENGGNR
jgi:hypothetical protein